MNNFSRYMKIARAMLVVVLILIVCASIYTYANDSTRLLYLTVLSSEYILYKPEAVMSPLEAGSAMGVILGHLLIALHHVVYVLTASLITTLVLMATKGKNEASSPEPAHVKPTINTNSKPIRMCLIQPVGDGDSVTTVYDPIPDQSFRFDRLSLREVDAETPIKKLEVAILEILYAHADIPACVKGYHSDATLAEHSVAVATEAYSQHPDEPLIVIAGLAHDLDKIVAYKKIKGAWRTLATHHHQYSAHVISSLKEFKDLPREDRITLTQALKYYHHPDRLPISSPQRIEKLISALRYADGLSTANEQKSSKTVTEEESNQVFAAILAALDSLNINNYLGRGSRPGGWTTPAIDYVAIVADTFVSETAAHMPTQLVLKTSMSVSGPRGVDHPGIALAIKVMKEKGLLKLATHSISSESGLFLIKAGVKEFSNTLLIDKMKIDELLPGLPDRWGTTPYAPRVLNASHS